MDNTTVEITKPREKLLVVDLLKGIAIIMVILVHIGQAFDLPRWLTLITGFGQMGCQIFFVISAFTICLSKEKRSQPYHIFIFRRLARLAPGWWSIIVITLILSIASVLVLGYNIFGTSHQPLDIVINVLFLNGLFPTAANNSVVRGGWFVGTIVLLYLLTPALYKLYYGVKSRIWEKNRRWIFPIGALLLNVAISLFIFFIDTDGFEANRNFIYFNIITQYAGILCWICLA